MQVKPFRAFRFNPSVVGDVGKCIAPPFDVISPSQQQLLYERSEYNIVRITKGKTTPTDHDGDNQYTRAAQYLNRWIKNGALKQDSADAIYGYVQDFQLAGESFRRFSFICLAKLEDFGPPGPVRPHEQVLNAPMVDRLNLKRATGARFGLVFMLYEDQQRIADKIIEKAAAQTPLVDFVNDDDVRHRIFAITSKEDIEAITKMMADKNCIIADGHHRYTTGLTYSKESGNPAARYQMLAFSNSCQDGLKVLATHRLIGNLEDFSVDKLIARLKKNFAITRLPFNSPAEKTQAKQKMLAQMSAEYENDSSAFGIYAGNGSFFVAVLRDIRAMDSAAPDKSDAWKEVDASILHKLILEKILGISQENQTSGENIEYVKYSPAAIDESISQVDSGSKQAALFMNPVKMQQLKMVTDAGERMPPKSTFFYPKMYTGLTIQKL